MFLPVSVCLLAGVLIELWMYLNETYTNDSRNSRLDFGEDTALESPQCSSLVLALMCSHSEGVILFNAHVAHCSIMKLLAVHDVDGGGSHSSEVALLLFKCLADGNGWGYKY